MSYLATVTNSVIDTANIKNILVQGESTHPQIVFSLSPTLTGLTWYVRATYLSFPLVTESDAITPVEGVDAVTVTWDVDASFTTLYGAVQLVLVGLAGSTTNVRAVGYVNVARDWSGENQGAITLDIFEQLMAQANTAASKYPIIQSAKWYTWNPTAEEYQDTGYAVSSQWRNGTGITGTSTTPTAFSGSGITLSAVGDMYINSSTWNTYICSLGGVASVARWAYVTNIKGVKGDTGAAGTNGVGVPTGGTTDQALVKTSGTNYATGWADISTERTATLTTGSWSGASAPYSQAVTITGVTTAGKPPIIDVVLSDTYATAQLELAAYGLVYRFKVTGDNTVTAYATAVPATAINVHAKLVR